MGLLGGYCETEEELAAIEQRDRAYMEAREFSDRIAELEAAVHDLLQQWDHDAGHAAPGPTSERLAEIRLLVGRT